MSYAMHIAVETARRDAAAALVRTPLRLISVSVKRAS